MPTTESAEAFSRLVAARTRLTRLTKLLNRAHTRRFDNKAARERYIRTQKEWQDAFHLFTAAAAQFSDSVTKLQEDVEAGRVPEETFASSMR
jgi:hypothetical protein